MPGKPKASRTRMLQGNRSRTKIPNESDLEFIPPKCPALLSKRARHYWKKLAPSLISLKRLGDIHAPLFAVYCETLAKIDDILKGINEANASLLQEDIMLDKHQQERYQLMESSYSKMFRLYSAQAHKLSKEFKLTPEEMKGVYHFTDEAGETEDL